MKKILLTLTALALTSVAQADVICAGCEYDEGAEGSLLGAFSGVTRDLATFTHTGIDIAPLFEDFWVFDISPASIASISADFTVLAPVFEFFGELYEDAGSVCPDFACTSIVLGDLLARAEAGGAQRFEINDNLIAFLPEGRYVLKIGGRPNTTNGGAYSGQLAVFGFTIREPGTLALLGLGLIGIALIGRRRRT